MNVSLDLNRLKYNMDRVNRWYRGHIEREQMGEERKNRRESASEKKDISYSHTTIIQSIYQQTIQIISLKEVEEYWWQQCFRLVLLSGGKKSGRKSPKTKEKRFFTSVFSSEINS